MRLRRTKTQVPDTDATATGRCVKHGFEAAAGRCSTCREEFCAECIVFPLGPARPLCVVCALVAAGLRRGSRLVRA